MKLVEICRVLDCKLPPKNLLDESEAVFETALGSSAAILLKLILPTADTGLLTGAVLAMKLVCMASVEKRMTKIAARQ